MATVFIEDLKVDTIIGICDWEQTVEQTLHFDIAMDLAIGAAAKDDDLSKAVDYAAVSEQVAAFVADQQGKLLETLVDGLLSHIMALHPALDRLQITVRKPQAIPTAACAGLTEVRLR